MMESPAIVPQWPRAKHFPVRPKPVMTSLAISSTPWRSQISRGRGKQVGGGTMTPPVPITGQMARRVDQVAPVRVQRDICDLGGIVHGAALLVGEDIGRGVERDGGVSRAL